MKCFFSVRENGAEQLCGELSQACKIGLRAFHCRFAEKIVNIHEQFEQFSMGFTQT